MRKEDFTFITEKDYEPIMKRDNVIFFLTAVIIVLTYMIVFLLFVNYVLP